MTGRDEPPEPGMRGKTLERADENVGCILLNNFEFRSLGGWGVPQAVVDKVLERELEYGQYQLQMVQCITGADR